MVCTQSARNIKGWVGKGWPEPHTYTMYIQYLGQGFNQIYDHIRCIYTVLT
jgi:hypothetical protein